MTDAPQPAFGFVKIIVKDMARIMDFYDRTVGLKLVRTIEGDGFVEQMMATPGMEKGPYIIFFHHTDGREISIGNGWGPVGFWVSGVDTAYGNALANGASPSQEPKDSSGFRVAYFFDPEGHEVEIVGTAG